MKCEERVIHNKPDDFWHHSVQAVSNDQRDGHFEAVFYNMRTKDTVNSVI